MTSHKLFSYGTLQYEAVQQALYGRKLTGSPDALTGFQLTILKITDPKVIELSGESEHKILKFTNNSADTVQGMVFDVTQAELDQTDEYEVGDYKRVSVILKSGVKAWLYAGHDVPGNDQY